MGGFEYTSIPSESLSNGGPSVSRPRDVSSGQCYVLRLLALASLALAELVRGALLLFAATARDIGAVHIAGSVEAYNIGRIFSVAFLSYIAGSGNAAALLYSIDCALVASAAALMAGSWAPATLLAAGLASGSAPTAVAALLTPGLGRLAACTDNDVHTSKTAAVVVALQMTTFAAAPILVSLSFSAAASLASVVWTALSLPALLVALAAALAATLHGAATALMGPEQPQSPIAGDASTATIPNEFTATVSTPAKAARRKSLSQQGGAAFSASASSARLDDLQALNPAGRAAKAALQAYAAVSEVLTPDHWFLLAQPLLIALTHPVRHHVASSHDPWHCAVIATAAAVAGSVGCLYASHRGYCSGVATSLSQGQGATAEGGVLTTVWRSLLPGSKASTCILPGLAFSAVACIIAMAYPFPPSFVSISLDVLLRVIAEPCVRWGVLVSIVASSSSSSSSGIIYGQGTETGTSTSGGGGEEEEGVVVRQVVFKRIQFQLSLVSIMCFVTQMIVHN